MDIRILQSPDGLRNAHVSLPSKEEPCITGKKVLKKKLVSGKEMPKPEEFIKKRNALNVDSFYRIYPSHPPAPGPGSSLGKWLESTTQQLSY